MQGTDHIAQGMPINEHIHADVYRYLDDNASVDAISCKLREVCPSLYRREDAACSKVTDNVSLFESLLEGSSEQSEQSVILQKHDLCLYSGASMGRHLLNCVY